MPRHSVLSRTAQVLFPILFCCGALAMAGVGSTKAPPLRSTSAVKVNCTATTDAEIVTAIQAKIKADKRFNNQYKHINVSSTNRVVTLDGWANGKVQVNDLLKFARTTKCVKKVVAKLATRMMVGCAAGQKQCGDICIDKNEQCNLIQGVGDSQ